MKEQNISCNLKYLVYLLFSLNFCDEEILKFVLARTRVHDNIILIFTRLDTKNYNILSIDRIDCVQKVREFLLLFLLWVLLQSCKKLQSLVESLSKTSHLVAVITCIIDHRTSMGTTVQIFWFEIKMNTKSKRSFKKHRISMVKMTENFQ